MALQVEARQAIAAAIGDLADAGPKSLAEGEVCKGKRSAETCVEERVISAPTIKDVLSSRFRITGLQAAEAHELALLLRSGALAAPQTIVEQRSIGPSLGQDNIKRGLMALAIGAILTFIFLAIYYRAFGLIANVVLLMNVVLLVALMSLLQASLSLAASPASCSPSAWRRMRTS